MKTKKNFVQKVKDLFVPPDERFDLGFREVLPFFFMLTVAVVWMYAVYVRRISSGWAIAGFTVLMLVHLGLYWAVFRFINSERNVRIYFIVQGLLVFVLVLFGGDFGLAIGLYASLIGNAVGVLRTSKDLLYFVPFFVLLGFGAVVVQSGIGAILDWAMVAIPSTMFSVFIAFLFRRQLQRREETEALYKDLQIAHAKLEAYAEQVEELTLMEERQRIARELHDTLAQELTGVVLQLEAVSTHIEKENNLRAQEILQDAMTQSRVTLAEARKVIDGLRTVKKPGETFADAVRQEAIRFESVGQIPCEVSCQLNKALGADLQDHLLKIISEGLNNIAKHAGASQAWLRVSERPGGLLVEIEDDGIGFYPGKKDAGKYGLLGIGERVEMLQGRFSIDSEAGKGTCLQVEIPMDKAGEINE